MQSQPNPGGAQAEAPSVNAPTSAPATAPTNTYGIKALLASLASLIVTAITAFVFEKVYFYFALLGVYGVYAGIRGIIASSRMPRRQGLATSIIGLILGVIAIAFTVWLFTP